jgi:hypothetical protein
MEAAGNPRSKGTVRVSRLRRGESERGEDLPGDKAPLAQPKKRSKGATERDEFLRVLWRTEVGRVDPKRLVFVDEMGTHTSLAPLYA